MNKIVTPVPFVEGHNNYHKYVESFPEQKVIHEGPGIPSVKQQTLDYLRADLIDLAMNRDKVEARLCYRTCFKWQETDFIDYCLKKQCGNPGFDKAATVLGYKH